MINFKIGVCPKCDKQNVQLMFSNNPLDGGTICFDCIKDNLNYQNLEHADFFCRTYNLPFNPELWIQTTKEFGPDSFREYAALILSDADNQPNLAYSPSTRDLWGRVNKEWEKCRSFTEVLKRLNPIRDSYVDRGRLKWGEQYTFEEIIKLDSIYSRTLKANNITNPMQKEAVKTLCKLQIEMDEAIRMKDAKAIKDFSNAWSTFAKQADLENMINETKTDDITTVAELYDYMEKSGFKFKFYDGFDRDEVDRTIKDIQDANRRLILESTGLQPLLEEMARKRMQTVEEEATNDIINGDVTLQDMLDFKATDNDIETEADEEVLDMVFDSPDMSIKIQRKDDQYAVN